MVFDAMRGHGHVLRRQVSSSSQLNQRSHSHEQLSSSSSSSLNEYRGDSSSSGGSSEREAGEVAVVVSAGVASAASASNSAAAAGAETVLEMELDGWQRKPLLRHGGEGEDDEEDEDEEAEEKKKEKRLSNKNGGVAMWAHYSSAVSIDDEPHRLNHLQQVEGGGSKVNGGLGGLQGGGSASSVISSNGAGGMVKISLPPPERDENKFPKEKWKTFLSFLFVCANWILTTLSLAVVHDRLPDRERVPPLPDVVFDLFPPQDWALAVSEVLIIVSVNTCLFAIFLHKHRFILLRRSFLILGVLYLMRCATMFVTQVPVASTTYYCSPKANSTSPSIVLQRMLQLISGFGLSINGQHTYCGDYIYSGHTVILTMSYMIIKEYTPRRCSLLHWISFFTSLTGVLMVLLSRGHYTVDVLLAYYVTTRVFWIYHTMANNPPLKVGGGYNYLSKVWWFCMFEYFERNVGGVVPRTYECPIPWPRRFVKRDRDS